MGIFCGSIEFTTVQCYKCHAPFALNQEHYEQRRKDHKAFYCPLCGQSQIFVGESEDQRKIRESNELLQKAQANLSRERELRVNAEQKTERVSRQYRKVRDRVKNGVCPCCNRSFGNLASHMKTQHPDFGEDKALKALRDAYGMTQAALASEVGVSVADIGNYEKGRRVTNKWRLDKIKDWVAAQAA